MKFSVTLAIALFLSILVNAQTEQPAEASGANITVQVAPNGNMSYSPSNFSAAAGSVVTFVFPKNSTHSVTQGSFDTACQYLNASDGNPAGFDSGSQSNSRYTITIVNSSEPVWFFCKYAKHCGFGMVGAINAPSTGNTFEAYLAAAKALGTSETSITDNGPVTGGVGAVATASATPIIGNSSASSPASHPVANGHFVLLAAALGIMLT